MGITRPHHCLSRSAGTPHLDSSDWRANMFLLSPRPLTLSQISQSLFLSVFPLPFALSLSLFPLVSSTQPSIQVRKSQQSFPRCIASYPNGGPGPTLWRQSKGPRCGSFAVFRALFLFWPKRPWSHALLIWKESTTPHPLFFWFCVINLIFKDVNQLFQMAWRGHESPSSSSWASFWKCALGSDLILSQSQEDQLSPNLFVECES